MCAIKTSYPQVIDLERYPFSDLSTPRGQALVDRCRRDLAETNVCVLPGFVPRAAIDDMAMLAEKLMAQAHYRVHDWNCYISRHDEPSLPDDHPRRRFFDDKSKIVAFDLLDEDALLRELYFADYLAPAFAAILGYERLYQSECPFQALNILGFDAGDSSPWHFDNENEFTVTLQLQSAESGGRFEIVPNIRSAADENYAGVQKILDGCRDDVHSYALQAGSLTIFRGRDSLHRVTTVTGARRRLVGVMCYERTRGVATSAEMNATIFGSRVAALVGLQ